MKRNQKVSKKRSVVVARTFRYGSVIVALFVMVLINLLASSSSQQLMKSIGNKQQTLKRLAQDYDRASAQWEILKTSESIDRALSRHALNMRCPKSEQVVRMSSSGLPYPGQRSVQMAKLRNGENIKAAKVSRRR